MNETVQDLIDSNLDIDDSTDKPTDKAERYENITMSSCLYEPVTIGLDENRREYRLEKLFSPQYDREITAIDKDNNCLVFPLEELQFLAFVNIPLDIDLLNINNTVEVIETFKGGTFTVHIPNRQEFATGFFGLSVKPADRYRYLFFPFNNIRIHYQQRPLGDIFVENNILAEDVLHSVLRMQYQLRCLRLGTIIAKRASLQPHHIEKTLQETRHKNPSLKPLTGEILVEAGLVSSRVVKQSLALQNRIRHLRVGELFVEMGYITEDQMFMALAKKFNRRFVSLHDSGPESEALACLPRNLIQELEILPLYLQGDTLVIATSDPGNILLNDFLHESLARPFELVISPRSRIRAALANLPA